MAQRLLDSGLRQYHLRFDRERNRRPAIPWHMRRHGIVLPEDTAEGSSEEESSDDYDSSVDGEDDGENDDDDEIGLPAA